LPGRVAQPLRAMVRRRSWARAAASSSEIEHHNSRDIGCSGLQDGFQPRHLASRQPVDPRARRRRRSRSRPAARPDRPRRRRGAARMGADQARDRGVTGSPLRLSPLAPARKTRRGAGARAPRSGPPGQSDSALEWLFLPQSGPWCRHRRSGAASHKAWNGGLPMVNVSPSASVLFSRVRQSESIGNGRRFP